MALTTSLCLCILFTYIESSFIQYDNQYPLWAYESTDDWIEYHSNNCTLIRQYHNVHNPHLDLFNISCTETDNPPDLSQYNPSQLFELYADNTYNIILFFRNDTQNMTHIDPDSTHKIAYNIYVPNPNDNQNNSVSNAYEITPIEQLPTDCYVTSIKIPTFSASVFTVCEMTNQNNSRYAMLFLRPWSYDADTIDNQYLYTCLQKEEYQIKCSAIGQESHSKISGCADISTARAVIPNQIYACPGPFTGGLYGAGAAKLCNTDRGYHICESQKEAKSLGLTKEICKNFVTSRDELYASKHNGSGNQNACGGDISDYIYGCALDEENNFDYTHYECLFNRQIPTKSGARWGEWQSDYGSAFDIELKDDQGGGVLCCNASASMTTQRALGCSNEYNSRQIIAGKVFACPGTFFGGLFSDSAKSLCHQTNGYHICESEQELQLLGFTADLCNRVSVTDDEFFATLHEQSTYCSADYGYSIFGCSNGGVGNGYNDGILNSGVSLENLYASLPNGWQHSNTPNDCNISFVSTSAGGLLCCNESASNYSSIYSQISGCSDAATSSREVITDNLFACRGTFTGGIRSESAESLCNREYGYRICQSWNEAQSLGMSRNICNNNVAIDDWEFFGTQQNQTQDCDWDAIFGCEMFDNSEDPCDTAGWNKRLDGSNWNEWRSASGTIDDYSLENDRSGGVLCCNASYLLPNTTSSTTLSPTTNPTQSPSVSNTSIPAIEGIGCSDALMQREIIEDKLYACSGAFGGQSGLGGGRSQTTGAYAELLCNDKYHICEDSTEAQQLGLTADMCTDVIPNNDLQFFGANDLCGCASEESNVTKSNSCGVLNSFLDESNSEYEWNGWKFEEGSFILNNSENGGVLCCIDSISLQIDFGYDVCTQSYEFSRTTDKLFYNIENVSIVIGDSFTTSESLSAVAGLIEKVPLLFDLKDVFSTFSFTITNIIAAIYIIIGLKWFEQDSDAIHPKKFEINSIVFLVALLQLMIIASFPMYTAFSSCLMDDLAVNLDIHIMGFIFGLGSFIFSFMWLVYICKKQTQCGLCQNEKYNTCFCVFWWFLFTVGLMFAFLIVPSTQLHKRHDSNKTVDMIGPYFLFYLSLVFILCYGWFIVWCKQCNYCNPCSCKFCGEPLECCGSPCRCFCKCCRCLRCCCPCCGQACDGMNLGKCYRFPVIIPFLPVLLPIFLLIDDEHGGQLFLIVLGTFYGCIIVSTFLRSLCNKILFIHFILLNLIAHPTWILLIKYQLTFPLVWMVIVSPIWITITFFEIKELRKFAGDVITIYLVTLDVITDMNLIFYWTVITQNYIWALLQALFIFIGQILSLSKEPGSKNKDKTIKKESTLTKMDKCMPFIGLGRPWYLVKAWSNESTKKYYAALNQRIKIWELMLESFPSVSLQIYVSMVSDEYSSSLVQSILASFISLTWTVWVFLLFSSTQQTDENKLENNTGATTTDVIVGSVDLVVANVRKTTPKTTKNTNPSPEKEETPKKWGYVKHNKCLYVNLYLFMISDFFIRTYPLIGLTALTNIYLSEYIAFGVLMVIVIPLLFFEFRMSKKMRIDGYNQNWFIFKIFSTHLMSSFYSLLSSLEIMKYHSFFGKSVIYEIYVKEHKLRLLMSIVLSVILTIFIWKQFNDNMYLSILVFMFWIFVAVNMLNLCYIGKIRKKEEMEKEMEKGMKNVQMVTNNTNPDIV